MPVIHIHGTHQSQHRRLPDLLRCRSMDLRSIAIIAHVDHGKTTLTDALLQQAGVCDQRAETTDLVLDSGDQERERGITITAKHCTIPLPDDSQLTIIDTPGHADFGSEVERVLGMADACLLVVDARQGPMPQTRFVLKHALTHSLPIIVVFNKIDQPGIDAQAARSCVFDLFIDLGASEVACDFPYVFAVGRDGRAGTVCDVDQLAPDLSPLRDLIVNTVPVVSRPEGAGQMLVSSLDYDDYLGRIAVGRVARGRIATGDMLAYQAEDASTQRGRAQKIFHWEGVTRVVTDAASAGQIAAVAGLADVTIGDTLCVGEPDPLPRGVIEPPTIEIRVYPNTSPLAGRDGTAVTTRQIESRLIRELETNVGLRLRQTSDGLAVAGRGELHLGVLLESLRREGMELAVGTPRVLRTPDGQEPYEQVVIDCPSEASGAVIQQLNQRGGKMLDMQTTDDGRHVLQYRMPTRGLLGVRSAFTLQTRGSGTLTTSFDGYGPATGVLPRLRNGAMIAGCAGCTTAFALDNLQQRATLFLGAGVEIYQGQVIGECSRDEELVVNPIKGKQLTNMRASGSDEGIRLAPPRMLTLEQAMEWISDDELLEITPTSVRLRKKLLTENARKTDRR